MFNDYNNFGVREQQVMNQNLIEINQDYGVVIDDNGNISSVIKSNGEFDFEEILEKENHLEVLNSKYRKVEADYDYALKDAKFAIAADTAVFILTAVGTIASMGISLPIMLLTSCGIYGASKLMAVFAYGTRSSRKLKQEELEHEIERLVREIKNTELELSHDKDRVKFNREVDMEVIKDIEIPFNLNQIVRDDKEKIKVISLRRKM